MGEIAKRGAVAKPPAGPVDPLTFLPAEWQVPVGRLFALYSDYLKGNAGLASRFALWIEDDGLTLDETRRAIRRVTRRNVMARVKYVGEFHAELAAAVDAEVEDRRKREKQDADRARYTGELVAHRDPAPVREVGRG